MKKSLVVYFSHDKENYVSGTIKKLEIGNTKVMANKIQKILDCDIFEIVPVDEYPYDYHECTKVAKRQLNNNERPELLNHVLNIDEYQNIYLGYPNWWLTMPMIVWTFLESYDLINKNIYPFCSHEGSGLGSSVNDIKTLCPSSNIKNGLAIYGSQVNQADSKIKKWLEEE